MGAEFLAVRCPRSTTRLRRATATPRRWARSSTGRAAELYAEQAPDVDIVITTALIPGRPAPRLITAEMVAAMKPGSVDRRHGRGQRRQRRRARSPTRWSSPTTASRSSATPTSPAGCPPRRSQLFGTNLVNLLKLLTPGKDGQLVLDLDDVVQRGMTVARDGERCGRRPPVQVSAAPAAQPASGQTVAKEPKPPTDPRRRYVAMAARRRAVRASSRPYSPPSFLGHFTVFALAVVVGYYVISNVAHALHTPLMAETNAISGIILVGGDARRSAAHNAARSRSWPSSPSLVASINIFGGFAVTGRMLQMFRKD